MSDWDVFDLGDDDGEPVVLAPTDIEVSGEQDDVTEGDGRFTARHQRGAITDPDSGATVKVDDFQADGSLDERGGSIHVRGSSITADSGDALGPVRITAHGPEADGYLSASDEKTGLGGHADLAGADVQLGDDGTHIKGGVSYGVGLGVEFATGEDADGDGYGEWGMRGEGGPLSASVRFEPGATVDGAVELADDASQVAADLADDPEGTVTQWSDDADAWAQDTVQDAEDTAADLVDLAQQGVEGGALDPSTPWPELGDASALPELPDLPTLPDLPDLPDVPVLPAVPDVPDLELPDLELPEVPDVELADLPALPDGPDLPDLELPDVELPDLGLDDG